MQEPLALGAYEGAAGDIQDWLGSIDKSHLFLSARRQFANDRQSRKILYKVSGGDLSEHCAQALHAADCVHRDDYSMDVDDMLNAIPERSSKALQKPQRTPKTALRLSYMWFGKPRPGAALTFSAMW